MIALARTGCSLNACPAERPPLAAMSARTRQLHDSIDAHARRTGLPYLHPDEPTVQLDLFGSARAIEWQEGKAAFLFASEGCWSELPHLYARYGTTATGALIARLKTLEHAGAALVCDSGMQATALVFDVLMEPGRHAVLMRQVYNKTRTYLEWLASRVGGVGHDRRRWRSAIAGGGDYAGDRVRLRRDLHQPAGARPGSGRAARRRRGGPRSRRRACAWSSTPRSPRRGRSPRRCSSRASTSCWPAAPRRSAAPIAICGATSPRTTRSLATGSWT